MSTDLVDSIDGKTIDAVALLARLGIQRETFQNVDARGELDTCLKVTAEIWASAAYDNFTDHSLQHSLRIIRLFEQIGPAIQPAFNDYERLVFGIAALIHDIGMQYNRWAKQAVSEAPILHIYTALEEAVAELQWSEARERHIELGLKLVNAFCREATLGWHVPFRFVSRLTPALTLLHRAALVGFAHSKGENLDWAKRLDNRYRDEQLEGNIPFRPLLLACIFRLCDELDACSSRVPHIDTVCAADIPEVSRLHWLACLFVRRVTVKACAGSVRIGHVWQVPEDLNLDAQVVTQIRDLLMSMRITKLNDELNDITCLLEEYNYFLNVKTLPLESEPKRFATHLSTLIVDLLARQREILNRPSVPAAVPERAPATKDGTLRERRRVSPVPATGSEGPLRDRLRQWFDVNALPGHFELFTGVHTDRYLHCRKLVSDQALLDEIVNEICSECSRMEIKDVSSVVGVGTSAIALAVNLGVRLGADVTFTFEAERSEPGRHFSVEIAPVMLPKHIGGAILVVDDVIAGGRVASQVFQTIRDAAPWVKNEHIVHCSIFKLGTEEYDPQGAQFVQLCRVPEVYYAADQQHCSRCSRGDAALHERELTGAFGTSLPPRDARDITPAQAVTVRPRPSSKAVIRRFGIRGRTPSCDAEEVPRYCASNAPPNASARRASIRRRSRRFGDSFRSD